MRAEKIGFVIEPTGLSVFATSLLTSVAEEFEANAGSIHYSLYMILLSQLFRSPGGGFMLHGSLPSN
jgi:hypothetical protein